MDLKQKQNRCLFVYGLVAVLLVINVCYLMATIATKNSYFGDFTGQRILCAYALNGINPFPLVGMSPPLLPEIGVIPSEFSTSPWGLVLGNLFYPAYLPLGAAKVYIIIFDVLLLLFTVYSLVCRLADCPKDFKIIAALLALTSQNVFHTIINFNAGFPICCFLLLACLYCDDHPCLAGIALAFAMVKPQVAALFCLAFLFQKRFKPVIIAAVIDLIAWGIASVMVMTSPVMLFFQFISCGNSSGTVFNGIFTLLFPRNISLVLSMLVGIAFVIMFDFAWRKKQLEIPTESFFRFYATCIAVMLWCYSVGHDRWILIVPALLCMWIMMREQTTRAQFFWFCMGAYCYLERTLVRMFAFFVVKVFLPEKINQWRRYGMPVYALGLIIVAFVMLRKLNGRRGLHDSARV